MAKTFDPSQLSAADQSAFAQWQQSLRSYVAQNGGGIPAPVSYALAHPEYLQSHPELKADVDMISGSMLPPAVREATKDYHPVWGTSKGGDAGMEKNSNLWHKWETWVQLGLGGVVGGVGAAGALGGVAPTGAAATSGSTAASTVPALEGGTTLAGNLGASSALGAGGAAGTGAAAATVPALGGGETLASNLGSSSAINAAGAAPAGTSSWWKDLLGIGSKADAVRTAANLAGNYLQSRQVDKAVQAQVDAANKALDLQSNIYQQQRSDLAPYRNVGSASIGELSRLVGLPAGSDTTTPYFQQQAASQQATAQQNQQTQNRTPPAAPTQAVPRSGTLAGLAQPTDQAGFVNMLSPDGRPAKVPQAQVQSAIAAGGRMA